MSTDADHATGPREITMGPEELFFSTTDPRGVILQGNSVFARISGYRLEDLIAAPHNIVRHPDMPAGVFHLMWEWLQQGRPVATYVCNRTADGGHYWVCAVVSPTNDGYVSVRMAPQDHILDVVRAVYRETIAVESDAAAGGLGRRAVAEAGRVEVEAALARRGYPSYEAFMHATLPAELTVRSRLASTTYQRTDAVGDVAQVLDGTRRVDGVLENLVANLANYQLISDELSTSSTHVLEVSQRLVKAVTAAQEASALVAERSPVLANVAKVMGTPMGEAVSDLERLPANFAQLRADLAEMRFHVALAALHNDMAAAFAAEVHDGVAPAESLSAIPVLCDAVEQRTLDMAARIDRVNTGLRQVSALVTEAGTLMGDFRRMIGQWRHLVFRHANAELKDHVGPIDEAVSATWTSTGHLTELGARAASVAFPFDSASLQAPLAAMRLGE